MRLVTWNCNMAWARKSAFLLAMRPDIVVLQECSERDARASGARHLFWTGSNPHKGLAVLVYGDLEARVDPCATTSLPWFLPVTIANRISLLAIWSCVKSWRIRYVKLSHQIVDQSKVFLGSAPIAIATGDLNSNTIWDGEHGDLSHSCLVARLETLGLTSAYHAMTGESQGEETQPTQFMYRHRDKAFHLDYTFATVSLLSSASLTVGDPGQWLSLSDHMPLVLDFFP